MRLAILTARPDLEVNRRLAVAGRSLGAETAIVDVLRVAALAGTAPLLWEVADGRRLEVPDAVVPRVGNWRPESVLAALEVLVAAGAVAVNSPAAIRTGRDHWRTVERLAAAGLPVPLTVAAADPERLATAAADHLGFPVVVKLRQSRMGVGVMRCDGPDQLDAVTDTLWRLGAEMVAQRYIATGGVSQRLVVVGGRVVAAARLSAAAGEWRSNAARGGRAEAYEPTPAERTLAVAAAAAVDLGVCGVDLLVGDETVVCEVNPTPGFARVEAATGIDVASEIVAETARRVRR